METNQRRSNIKSFCIVMIVSAVTLFSTSCGEGGLENIKIPGVDGPSIELTEEDLIVEASFEKDFVDQVYTVNVPEYASAQVQVGPMVNPDDPSATGTYMRVTVSIDDILDSSGNIKSQPEHALPGGRLLPGISSGKLPGVAFTADNFRGITFYLGTDFFGLFVPFSIEMDSTIITTSFSYKNIRTGTLSLVGPDNDGNNSGFLLLLDLSDAVRRELRKILDNPDYLKRLKKRMSGRTGWARGLN